MLTWHAIHEALPKLSKRARDRTKAIRSCLLELGNLFLQEQLWSPYRRNAYWKNGLRSTPVMFVEHVAAFERWASHGMLNPKLDINLPEAQPLTNTSRAHTETIKTVVTYSLSGVSSATSAHSPTSTESTIESYKETLFWQLECNAAESESHLDVAKTNEMCSDQECQAINSYVKIRRLTRASVTQIIM